MTEIFFKKSIKSSFIFSTLLFALIAVSDFIQYTKAEECGTEEFARCAEPLDMLHLTSEFSIGTAKKEELDKICHELRKGIRCIQSYTRRCMDLQQRNEFNKLYHGTNQFIRDLCNEGEFQDEYLKHASCAERAKPDFEICAKRYKEAMVFISPTRTQENITISDNIKTICCSLNELVECLEQSARRTCGNDAAKFTKELVEKFVVNLTKLYCTNYSRHPELCGDGDSSGISWRTENWNSIMFNSIIGITLISIFR